MSRSKINQFIVILSLALVGVMALSCTKGSKQQQSQLIPRETVFSNPTKWNPKLSPDGRYVAYMALFNDIPNVWVMELGKEHDSWFTQDRGRGIRDFYWSGDGKQILVLQDIKGNDNWRLIGMRTTDHFLTDYTPFDSIQVQFVAQDLNYPDEILISMNKLDRTRQDVYDLSLTDGSLELITKNPGSVFGWVTDTRLQVRGAMSANQNGGFDLLVRNSEITPWKSLIYWDNDLAASSGPICFSRDGSALYVTDGRETDGSRVRKIDLSSGSAETLAEDAQYSIAGMMIDPINYTIEAVGFYRHRLQWKVLDEAVRVDMEAISKLTNGDFTIVNRDITNQLWLIRFIVDTGSEIYYVYDRQTRQGKLVFDSQPELKKFPLAQMEPVSFKVRDGMDIHGYVTYPVGKSKKHLPMVVNVHGGPWQRDNWGYNQEAQWLASRGYACLQVNYRGSTGYGNAFTRAGDREWGGKMQNDLTDAVQWAVKQGIADPKKVAIMGQSYGGYAALQGTVVTPNLFACAVDISGPCDLMSFISSVPPNFWGFRDMITKRIGDPDKDAEMLKSRSPVANSKEIKTPLLIIQGAIDPRVDANLTEKFVAKLRLNSQEVEYLTFPDEGHDILGGASRLKMYAAIERFLAKYLGGSCEEYKGELATK